MVYHAGEGVRPAVYFHLGKWDAVYKASREIYAASVGRLRVHEFGNKLINTYFPLPGGGIVMNNIFSTCLSAPW